MINKENKWDQMFLHYDDACLTAPCFYFELNLGFTSEEVILDFYDKAREALGDELTHYTTGSARWKKITDRTETMVPTWCKKLRLGRDKRYYIEFTGADNKSIVSPFTLSLHIDHSPPFSDEELKFRMRTWKEFANEYGRNALSRPYSTLRLSVPVDHNLANPKTFIEWMLQLKGVNNWLFHSALAGYGLNSFSNATGEMDDLVVNKMRSLLSRYIGLDSDVFPLTTEGYQYDLDCINTQKSLLPVIRRINWMTVINDIAINHLGGKEWLKSRWEQEQEVKWYDLKYGAAIQAGEKPLIGNIEKKEMLPSYRKVAKELKRVQIDIDWISSFYIPYLKEVEWKEWLAAFDINHNGT